MAKTKKKLLPKNFEALLEKGDLNELKTLFDTYDVNARGGSSKQTALAFDQCPDELARWLVKCGADFAACDSYGNTPLHTRSRHWKGRIAVLLKLGADVNHGENKQGTPLHAAAESFKVAAAGVLIQHDARVDALDGERQTPLALALRNCNNINIPDMLALAKLLLAAGARTRGK